MYCDLAAAPQRPALCACVLRLIRCHALVEIRVQRDRGRTLNPGAFLRQGRVFCKARTSGRGL